MSKMQIENLYKETGALKKGHFLLASGLHSEFYFQAQSLLQYPAKASKAAEKIALKWKDKKIDTVVSPAVGAIVLGQEVARALNCRHIFVERKNNAFTFKRGFSLRPSEKVLVVEDVVTTGVSVKEAIEVIKKYKANILGIASLLSRGDACFSYAFTPLVKVKWPTYEPQKCPLCQKKIPVETPGTRQAKN